MDLRDRIRASGTPRAATFGGARSRAVVVALIALGALPLSAAVSFSSGVPAHVVAQPKTDLARRTTDRLATYLTQVLGVPARVVPELAVVPAGVSAIIFLEEGTGTSGGLAVPPGSEEAFVLEDRVMDG